MPSERITPNLHRFRVRQSPGRSSRRSASPRREDESVSPGQLQGPSPTSDETGSATAAGIGGSSAPVIAAVPKKSKERTPACERCRVFKKKCSRTFPVCSLCASAGQACSFSTPAASPAAQVLHLRARIEWLTSLVNANIHLPGLEGIETVDTGTDVSSLMAESSIHADKSTPTRSAIIVADAASSPDDGLVTAVPAHRTAQHEDKPQTQQGIGNPLQQEPTPSLVATVDPDSPISHHSGTQALKTPGSLNISTHHTVDSSNLAMLAQDTLGKRLIDAYFRNINKAYPFIDREKLLRNADVVGTVGRKRGNFDSTLLYLVMALGCTTLQRAGQVPPEMLSTFQVSYADIIQECLIRHEEIEAMQVLVLLALYALFDPKSTSTASITGLAARQAIIFGLCRAQEFEMAGTPHNTETELRYRLFWSIYVLDRMMSSSLGLPVAMTDENMNIPLPALTTEEFNCEDRQVFMNMLQTNRHVIQLRQLEDRIMSLIHTRKESEIAALSKIDRQVIVKEIKSELENWYSSGCLASPLEPDNVPIHSSLTWLSARYYHTLLLLHYPCHFNSCGSLVSAPELFRLAQKHLQSTALLLQLRQLPLNRITLFRIFPVGLILLHCFITCPVDYMSYSTRDDVSVIVRILEAFPETWTAARQASLIFKRLMTIVSGKRSSTASGFSSTPSGYYSNGLKSIIDEFLALMRQVLGNSTCYALYKVPDDCESHYASNSETAGGMNGQTLSSLSTGTGLNGGGANMTNDEYGWTNLELGFL